MIQQKLIEHDYLSIWKVSVLQAMPSYLKQEGVGVEYKRFLVYFAEIFLLFPM